MLKLIAKRLQDCLDERCMSLEQLSKLTQIPQDTLEKIILAEHNLTLLDVCVIFDALGYELNVRVSELETYFKLKRKIENDLSTQG